MAVILAVETATHVCSVALGGNGTGPVIREELFEKQSHAGNINVFAQEVLSDAGLSFADVDAFAVGVGPGSYTGLRIGLSAIKGWCFALDRPVIGISTLRILVEQALRHGVSEDMELWPMIDARRMEVFTQPFDHKGGSTGTMAPLVLDEQWVADATRPRMVFGDGADKAADLWTGKPLITHLQGIHPAATALVALAEKRFAAGEFDDLAYLVPGYGKEPHLVRPKSS